MRPKLPRLSLRRAMLLIALVAILATATIRALRRPYPVIYLNDGGIGFIQWSDGSGGFTTFTFRSTEWGPLRVVEWGDGSFGLHLRDEFAMRRLYLKHNREISPGRGPGGGGPP